MITVTASASDRNLLSPPELRAAVGLAAGDTSQDAALATIGLRVSDRIADWCGVAGDGLTPPTLRRETITETQRHAAGFDTLMLARRFVAVTSITVDGVESEGSLYEVQPGTGMVRALDTSGYYACWPCGIYVVAYEAGFAAVPEPLKEAAAGMVRLLRARGTRDPLLKREDIVDVGEQEFWVGSVGAIDIPDDVKAMLAPYRTIAVG